MVQLIELFFLVLVASSFLIWIVKLLSVKFKWESRPQGDRWNARKVSLYGGAGFFPIITFGFCFLFFQNYSELVLYFNDTFEGRSQNNILLSILLGSVSMFILGLVDDINNCRPIVKIITQIIATGFFIYGGGGFSIYESNMLNIVITLFWFFIVINAVNLMDNMDGLASGVVIIALIFLIIISNPNTTGLFPLSIYISVITASSLLAFLFFNWIPAKIFMGDSGSLPIGFILAALLIPGPINSYLGITQDSYLSTSVMSLLIPMLIIVTLLFDIAFVAITRFLEGKSIMQGGKDHTSHRFVRSGLTEKQSIILIFSLSITGGVCAVLLLIVDSGYGIFFTLFSIFILLILQGTYLSRVPSS